MIDMISERKEEKQIIFRFLSSKLVMVFFSTPSTARKAFPKGKSDLTGPGPLSSQGNSQGIQSPSISEELRQAQASKCSLTRHFARRRQSLELSFC